MRRVDCTSNGCPDGCNPDEMAISAFCGPHLAPTSTDDRNVACVGQTETARPRVLICIKR